MQVFQTQSYMVFPTVTILLKKIDSIYWKITRFWVFPWHNLLHIISSVNSVKKFIVVKLTRFLWRLVLKRYMWPPKNHPPSLLAHPTTLQVASGQSLPFLLCSLVHVRRARLNAELHRRTRIRHLGEIWILRKNSKLSFRWHSRSFSTD